MSSITNNSFSVTKPSFNNYKNKEFDLTLEGIKKYGFPPSVFSLIQSDMQRDPETSRRLSRVLYLLEQIGPDLWKKGGGLAKSISETQLNLVEFLEHTIHTIVNFKRICDHDHDSDLDSDSKFLPLCEPLIDIFRKIIFEEKGLKGQIHYSCISPLDPQNHFNCVHFIKEGGRWIRKHTLVPLNATEDYWMPPSQTRLWIFDKQHQPVTHPCILISGPKASNKPSDPLHFLRVDYYLGMPSPDDNLPNIIPINVNFTDDFKIKDIYLEGNGILTTEASEERALKHVNDVLVNIREDLKSHFEKAGFFISYNIHLPRTNRDWEYTTYQLLAGLATKPSENARLIQYLADEMGLTLESTEEATGDEGSTVEMDPKEALKLMIGHVKEQLDEAQKIESLGAEKAIDARLIAEDNERKTKIMMDQKHQEKGHPHKKDIKQQVHKKLETPAPSKVKASTSSATTENNAVDVIDSLLTGKENALAHSILAGNPAKAAPFRKIILSILEKQVAAQQEAGGNVTVTQHTRGAHPKIHFKRAEKSEGITLSNVHGNKGKVEWIVHQQKTLKDALSIFN